MVAGENDGAGTGGDRSGSALPVPQQINGHFSGLAGQPSLQAPPLTSTSSLLPSGPSHPLTEWCTNAPQPNRKDDVTNAESTDEGATVVGRTVVNDKKHRRRSSATPTLSIDTHAMGRQDKAHESRSPSLSPVSPKSPPQMNSPFSPFRSPSSSGTRDRGFSLRRTILARKLHEQPESSGSAMELRPTAASAAQHILADSNSGKKSEATITILPVLNSSHNLETDPQSTKTPYELLALPRYEEWIKSKAFDTGLFARLRAAKERLRKKILRIQEIPPSNDGRHIDVNPNRREPLIDERTGRGYIKNTITSSRYTLYNFVPRQLFAQFSKLANFYFLCVSILQMIPGLSTTGTYTTIVPLTFFVVISMAKEGYDDLRRYRLDKAENSKGALVLRGHKISVTSIDNENCSSAIPDEQKDWAETKWEDIGVGDIVKLARDEAVPADLVLLCTDGAEGIAYVETMALDGETNLKSKQALPQLARSSRTVEGSASCEAHLVVEDPNLNLFDFEGRVTVGNETLPLANNEIIYRGSVLRNTSEAIGIVVYSGEECKIRMNATKNPRIKAVSIRTSCSILPNMAPADVCC